MLINVMFLSLHGHLILFFCFFVLFCFVLFFFFKGVFT